MWAWGHQTARAPGRRQAPAAHCIQHQHQLHYSHWDSEDNGARSHDSHLAWSEAADMPACMMRVHAMLTERPCSVHRRSCDRYKYGCARAALCCESCCLAPMLLLLTAAQSWAGSGQALAEMAPVACKHRGCQNRRVGQHKPVVRCTQQSRVPRHLQPCTCWCRACLVRRQSWLKASDDAYRSAL